MGNPINPCTGIRYSGRVSAERIRADAERCRNGTGDAARDSGIPDETGDGDGTGDSRGIGSNGSTGSTGTNGPTERIPFLSKARAAKPNRVAVKSQTEQPDKETKPRYPKGESSGAIKPEHIETWMTQIFGLAAMIKNADYWAIRRPDIEVRPWAGSAAEIVNKMSGDQAEKIAQYNAATMVAVGITSLVLARVQMDRTVAAQLRLERAKSNVAQRRAEEGINTENINPDVPAGQNGRATVSGTGATPAAPSEPLFGNNPAI